MLIIVEAERECKSMYEKLSGHLAQWCQNRCQVNEEEREAVEYGIRIVILAFCKFWLFVFLGSILGYGKEVIVALIVFGSIRRFAGGIHMSSSFKCTLAMGCMLSVCIWMSNYPKADEKVLFFFWITTLASAAYFAPADFTKNKGAMVRWKQKVKAICIINMWYIAALMICKTAMRNVIIAAAVIEAISLIPYEGKNEGERA